jgi:hypothetical protein
MIIEDSARYWVGHDHKGPWPPKLHYLRDRYNVVVGGTAKDWTDNATVIEQGAEFSDSYNFLRVPLRWGFTNYDDALLFMLAFPTVYTEDWRIWEEDEDE